MGTVDQGFVPAPPDRVYARLAGVDAYGAWWPGVRVGPAGDGEILGLPGLGTVRVAAEDVRPGTGLRLRFHGARVSGSLEWYLEAFKDGTVVNAILEVESRRRARRRTARLRADLRESLVALRRLAEAA